MKLKLGERVKQRRIELGLSRPELCKKTGITLTSLVKLEDRPQSSSKFVTILAKCLNTSPEWLTDGIEPMSDVESNVGEKGQFEVWSDNEPLPSDEYVDVPFLKDVEFRGGAGAFEAADYNDFKLPFAKSTLYKQGVSAKDAICVTLTGDSMEPVLPKGTSCGINTADKIIIDGDHYAINHGGLLRIKKLYRLPDNQIRINSWNETDYPDETVAAEEVEIVGKVFYWSVLS